MARSFVATKPLQAAKLGAVLLTIVFAIGGFFRLFSPVPSPFVDWQLTALLLVPFLSLLLVLVVTLETVVAGYRIVRADDRWIARLTARPTYTIVRGVEATIALLGTVAMYSALTTLADGPIPAPAGVGLALIFFALGLLVLVASLARTLVEYYYHRRRSAAAA